MNRRRLGKAFLLLATALCLSWLVPTAAADSNARIVRLSYVNGDVQVDRRAGQGFEQAIMNMPIAQGTRVWTRGSEALAEIEFEDGSTMRLTPDTNVEFHELSLRSSGEKVNSIELQGGTAYFDLRDHMGDFRVATGGRQITVDKPARFRVLADKSQFKVAVYKGKVGVRSGANELTVRKDETFALDTSNPDHYNLAKSIAEGSYDDWNQQRQRYSESYTSSVTTSGSSGLYGSSNLYYDSFSPYYNYGLADLGYYGNFFYAPGWGWMWRPYYMGAGWNPFMDGAWAWYPQFGYTWISSYPWGWMPYRYGAWNFVPGYGWCWMPGTVWNTWAPVTVVNRPPVNWTPVRPPAAPPQPGTAGIVPVGRGWGTVYPPGLPAATVPTKPRWGMHTGTTTFTGGTSTVVNTPTTNVPITPANVPTTKPAPKANVGPAPTGHGQRSVDAPRGNKPAAPAATPRAPSAPRTQSAAPAAGHGAGMSSGRAMSSWSSAGASSSGHSGGGGSWGGGGGGHSSGGGRR